MGLARRASASEAAPYNGNGESSGRPSVDVTSPVAGSEGGYGGYGDYAGYGGYGAGSNNTGAGYGGYSAYGESSQAEEVGGEEAGDASGYSAPGQTPFYGYEPHGAQKPQFVSNVEAAGALEGGEEGGFVSPFDALSANSRTLQPSSQGNQYAPSYSRNHADEEDEEDDDLGLGNSTGRSKSNNNAGAPTDDYSEAGDVSRQDSVASSSAVGGGGKQDDAASNASGGDDKKPELKASASWFGRLWGRSASTDPAAQAAQAKAKKAHLGEETSFVYDKDLKRWVNKKVGGDSSAASTPPPPPPPARSQSASPQRNLIAAVELLPLLLCAAAAAAPRHRRPAASRWAEQPHPSAKAGTKAVPV